eukprot:7271017-Prymnesium_polylepis.1
MACEACETPTSASPGSDACSVCARFFFKENVSRDASAANCRPCPTGLCIDGWGLTCLVVIPAWAPPPTARAVASSLRTRVLEYHQNHRMHGT